ncbi:MAG: PAS domain S-box protein [Ignavibacteriales bacterium]|nr:PAS domain S-box protein [Ignavibacteriales bacterium]
MEIKNKEWLDILGRNSDYHGDPLIILDDSFEIIFTNQKASTLFIIDDFHISLEQVFEKETVQKLTDFIGPVLNSLQKKLYKTTSINLKSGNKLDFDILIEPIKTDETINAILVFRNIDNTNCNDLLSRIKIASSNDIISTSDAPLKSIITELHSEIPFTIISLKRAKNVIDNYDFPIWIKDVYGKLIIINDAYSGILGVENTFAAGKMHETFLPPNQKAIYKMIDHYVLYNAQQIILEGLGKKNKNFEVINSIIQVPLVDNFNKILAMVGLIVDNKYDYYNFWGGEEFFKGLIQSFPKPAAYLSSIGVIKFANDMFVELFKPGIRQIVDENFDEVFSDNLINKIELFFDNDLAEDFILLDENLVPKNSLGSNDKLLLLKISSKENNKPNVFVTIESQTEPINFEDELQNILMHRGIMFDILIQKNPEPIFVYEKENLKFLEVNDATVKLYGYTRDEFLQMDLTDLYAPEDIQTLLDSFGDEASESRFSKPFRHRKKDGTNVLVEISKTSFKFNDKEAHFNIVKDITDSVEKDKQYQILKIVFNESDLLIFSTDASGFITFANQNVFQNLGYTNNEILQSSFASLVGDEDRGIVNTSIFQSHLKDSVVLQSKFKNSLGNLIDSEILASPVLDFDGGVDSFTIIVKPLSEKFSFDQPKEIIKEVIKEVVKEVVVEKQIPTKPKVMLPDSNFLSGMFHEILTPINVIIGFSQELISSTENPTEEQIEASEIINQNRIKMMDTMNAVVEYSDIMQNKSPLKIEDVTITDVIEKLDENIKDITGINDIQFAYGKISSSLKFKSDKQKFENFILSLIKVVSRLSKDKKVYFSGFAVESDSFLIGISDQYGNPSEYVANVLEQVFGNDRDPKDFGLPKLTTYLARILLKFLGGKFYKSATDTYRNETGFIFPIELSTSSEKQNFDSVQEIISSIPSSENIATDTVNRLTEDEIEKVDESEKLIEAVSEKEFLQEEIRDIPEEVTTEKSADENTDDIFKPVSPISQALLSKIEEVEEVEYDSKLEEIQSFEILDENKSEEIVDNTFDKTEPEEYENISETIVDEFAANTESIEEEKPAKILDLTKLSCLYIEDQVDSQILFKVQMKELRDVKFAVSFEEAQLVLLNHQFDFIVMDINLQGEYNGLDALKIIKTMPAFSSIPIISVTAYVLPGDKEKFIAAGFDDFISKPIFKEKMIESLEKIFLRH